MQVVLEIKGAIRQIVMKGALWCLIIWDDPLPLLRLRDSIPTGHPKLEIQHKAYMYNLF